MSCRVCHDLIQRHLDGSAPPPGEQRGSSPLSWGAPDRGDEPGGSPEIDRHLHECPRCATLFAAAHRLREGLRLLVPPAPPAGLADRLTARLCAEAGRHRRRRWTAGSLGALAAAAAVLLALGLALQGTPREPGAQTLASVATDKGAPDRPAVRESMAEAGSAVAALTGRTADATLSQTAGLLPPLLEAWAQTPLASPDTVEPPPLEAPARPFREAGAGLSAGLEPVADSARRAVDLFLRDLPSVALGEGPAAGARPAPKGKPG
jgi:hypothetical protein